jgi:hypothetical protein
MGLFHADQRGDHPLHKVGGDGFWILAVVGIFSICQVAHDDDVAWIADSFVGIKIIMGVKLLIYATKRRAGMEAREVADAVNDFGRDPIGEGKEEQVCTRSIDAPCPRLTSHRNIIAGSRHCSMIRATMRHPHQKWVNCRRTRSGMAPERRDHALDWRT